MNILIDIGHPAHVHLLRNTYRQLLQRHHNVWVTVRDIPAATTLLSLYHIPFVIIGAKRDYILGKALSQPILDAELLHFVKKHHIQLGIGTSITLSHVGKLSSMKTIILDDDDDEVEPLFVRFVHPFADVILSPDCIHREAPKTIYYAGYHDLAYLHPNVFTPDPSVLQEAGITEGEPYFILRFNAFKAHHDVGEHGLTLQDKRRLIHLLEPHGRVFITSERNLEPEFQQFRLSVSPDKIHSLMYYATMFIGDSQSMTSEAAVLGTPALKCNTFAGRLAVPNELEQKYGLCYAFQPTDFERLLITIQDLLAQPDLKLLWRERVDKMLQDKIDVTSYFIDFIEHFPHNLPKRILIDIGHPAHVHMFRYFAHEMQARGHKVLFTCRTKEFETELLQAGGFDFINLGKKSASIIGKVFDLLRFDAKVWGVARRFKPDVFVSHGSIVASHIAWLRRKPHVSFEDTFNMEQVRLYAPFTKVIITANYDNPISGRSNVLACPCYNELLYLHPNRFTPDRSVRGELGLKPDERYIIIRFVGWNATHDLGNNGISLENKIRAVRAFEPYARVFISSESPLPKELHAYRFPLRPERMHDAEAFASLVFGESATMASEAAVLGVPSIYIDTIGRYYTRELESKYGLCYNFTESPEDQVRAIDKGVEILSGHSNVNYQAARAQLLKDKIDVTAFFVDFIEKM